MGIKQKYVIYKADVSKVSKKTDLPAMYRVYLLNDDFTPMDFVVEILESVFGMNHDLATQIMLRVHLFGQGSCGVFSKEVAETKTHQVNLYARQFKYPLLCKMEKN